MQPIFYCPSRRPIGVYPGTISDHVNVTNYATSNVAKTDYAANGGSIGFNFSANCSWGSCNGLNDPNDMDTPASAVSGATSLPQMAAKIPPPATYNWYLAPYPKGTTTFNAGGYNPTGGTPQGTTFTGVAWYRSQVALRQITDGASKVYLFGEKYVSQMSALHDRRRQRRRGQHLSGHE